MDRGCRHAGGGACGSSEGGGKISCGPATGVGTRGSGEGGGNIALRPGTLRTGTLRTGTLGTGTLRGSTLRGSTLRGSTLGAGVLAKVACVVFGTGIAALNIGNEGRSNSLLR